MPGGSLETTFSSASATNAILPLLSPFGPMLPEQSTIIAMLPFASPVLAMASLLARMANVPFP